MLPAALLRGEIDRQIRPGQNRGAVVAHRLLRYEGLGPGNACSLNHYDAQEGNNICCARYGRATYGGGRYAL